MIINNTKEIFERIDLRKIIRNYILSEDFGCVKTDYLTYEEHMKESCAPMLERIDALYEKEGEEHSDAICEFEEAIFAYRDVYAEIGMKIGVQLLFQLLCKNG